MITYNRYRYTQDGLSHDVMIAAHANKVIDRIVAGFIDGVIRDFELVGTVKMQASRGKESLPDILAVIGG